MVEITSEEQNKEKRMKRIEDSLRDLWDNIKLTNIRIIGVPEEEEKKKGTKKIFEEIIVENFPNMEKEIVSQVQEAQRVPYRIHQTILQTYSNQDSMVLAQKQKYRSMEQYRKPRDKPTYIRSPFL